MIEINKSVVIRILENQEMIMLALNKLLTPHCKGMFDHGETKANAELLDCYHKTRILLGKE